MCLQHVDSLDGVLFLAARVDRADGQHGIDGDGSEKVVVPVGRERIKIHGSKFTSVAARPDSDRRCANSRSKDLGAHRRLGHIDQTLLS